MITGVDTTVDTITRMSASPVQPPQYTSLLRCRVTDMAATMTTARDTVAVAYSSPTTAQP